MRYLLFLFIAFFCFLPVGFSANNSRQEEVVKLTFSDSLELAFKNNKDILIKDQDINIADADILESYSKFIPHIDVATGYQYTDAVLNLGPLGRGGKKAMGIVTGYRNNNIHSFTISESLYNGGENIAKLAQAKVDFKIAQQELRLEKINTDFEARRLYYGLLFAIEVAKINQDFVDQARAHYRDVNRKYKQGTVSRYDLLQSRVQVAKAIPELIASRNDIEIIAADLKKLLGLPIQSKVKALDKLVCTIIDVDELSSLDFAYKHNPQMILKILGVDISKLDIDVARSSGLPQVDIGGEYNWKSNNTADMYNDYHNNWNAKITFSMPIFDGFYTRARVDAAKARYAQSKLSKENTVDQIAVNIKQACLDLRENSSIIHYQKKALVEAQEALRISIVSYDVGESTNLDVYDSEVSLSKIRKNLSSAIYDYIMAKASLDKNMGILSLAGEELENKKKKYKVFIKNNGGQKNDKGKNTKK